jgi:hypothetical protein
MKNNITEGYHGWLPFSPVRDVLEYNNIAYSYNANGIDVDGVQVDIHDMTYDDDENSYVPDYESSSPEVKTEQVKDALARALPDTWLDVFEKLKKYIFGNVNEAIEIGKTYTVHMPTVEKHDNTPQYIKLVKQAIKNGEGKVYVASVSDKFAEVRAWKGDLLGDVRIPVSALMESKTQHSSVISEIKKLSGLNEEDVTRELIIDDSRGIHIPQFFATHFDMDAWGVSDEQKQVLMSGADTEEYWDVWDEVLRNATYNDGKGHTWTLEQDGDVFAVRDDAESVNEEPVDEEPVDDTRMVDKLRRAWGIKQHEVEDVLSMLDAYRWCGDEGLSCITHAGTIDNDSTQDVFAGHTGYWISNGNEVAYVTNGDPYFGDISDDDVQADTGLMSLDGYELSNITDESVNESLTDNPTPKDVAQYAIKGNVFPKQITDVFFIVKDMKKSKEEATTRKKELESDGYTVVLRKATIMGHERFFIGASKAKDENNTPVNESQSKVSNVWSGKNKDGEEYVYAKVGSGKDATIVTVGLANNPIVKEYVSQADAGNVIGIDTIDDVKKVQHSARDKKTVSESTEDTYTVWVGGTEVNDYLLSKEDAERLAQEYRDKGYDDVVIDDTTTVSEDIFEPASPEEIELRNKQRMSAIMSEISDETKKIVEELMESEGLSKLENVDDSGNKYISVEADGKEYAVYLTAEDAELDAIEYVKDLFNDDALSFNADFIKRHFDEEAYLNDVYNDIETWVKDDPKSYAHLVDGEPDENGEYSEDQIQAMIDKYMEDIRAQGVLKWLLNELGYTDDDISKEITKYVDIDKMAQDAVDTDNPEHFLSRYDSKVIELPSGAVAYRRN